jgi:tellurite methyltransferase
MSHYWNNFYKENFEFENQPSTFCTFVLEYLREFKYHKTLIDIGFGNGRDINKFKSEGYECTGVELSKEALNNLKKIESSIILINDDFENHNYDSYHVYYSRFTLHAITHDEILKFINNISKSMTEDSILFVETRSTKMTKSEGLDYEETIFKSGIGDFHKRTLISIEYLRKILNRHDLYVDYEIESNGLSPYKGEDPYLIRMIVSKIDVKKKLRTLINSTQKRQFYLKKITDEIINLLESNKIEYGIFFGNLIGLLRHNELFAPWDDDIDFVVNKKDIEKIKIIIQEKFEIKSIVSSETTLQMIFSLKEMNIWIDFFFDVNQFCKVDNHNHINLSNFEIKNGYKYPKDFKVFFEKFYNQKVEDILENCVIYNHEYNNRWKVEENSQKLRIGTKRCKKIIEEINLEISTESLIESKIKPKKKSNESFIIDTSNFKNIEEVLDIINTINEYDNIYLKIDEFFSFRYDIKDLPELGIFIYSKDIDLHFNTYIIQTNQINNILLESIKNKQQILVESEVPNIIDFICYNFDCYLFGMTLILLKLNKKSPILQFLIIDKVIDFVKIKKLFKIIESTEHWVKFEYNDYFIVEIFEYKLIENDLRVQEEVYKNLPLYDNLEKYIKKINLNLQNSVFINDYKIIRNLEIKESDIENFCKIK